MNNSNVNKNFILGSGSARRIDLLNQIGVQPDLILKPNVNATSGLTEIQETLYSPTEKLMAKRMNKNRGTA